MIFASYKDPIVPYAGIVDDNNGLVMIKFICLGLILFIRNQCNSNIVTGDSTEILQRITKFPPIEDILLIFQLASQCKKYLSTFDDTFKPKLAPLNFKSQSKTNGFRNSINANKNNSKSISKKIKSKKKDDSIDLAVISVTEYKDNNPLSLINQLITNIRQQIGTKKLDNQKIILCISLLKALKHTLSQPSNL
jgi:hypothetical protein